MKGIYRADDLGNKKVQSEKSLRTNKLNFKTYKNNTINSLNEVECFLNNCCRFSKYIKLYNILK